MHTVNLMHNGKRVWLLSGKYQDRIQQRARILHFVIFTRFACLTARLSQCKYNQPLYALILYPVLATQWCVFVGSFELLMIVVALKVATIVAMYVKQSTQSAFKWSWPSMKVVASFIPRGPNNGNSNFILWHNIITRRRIDRRREDRSSPCWLVWGLTLI